MSDTDATMTTEDGEQLLLFPEALQPADDDDTCDELEHVKELVEQIYWADGGDPVGVDNAAYRMVCALRRAIPLLEDGEPDEALLVIVEEMLPEDPADAD